MTPFHRTLLTVAVCAGAGIAVSAGIVATRPTRRERPEAAPAAVRRLRVRRAPDGQLHTFDVYYRDLLERHPRLVRRLAVTYRAWNGADRTAYVLLPRWYSRRLDPALPLVISPHGRGIEARNNLHFWGALPAFGPFAVVSPEGQGRRLVRYSWGWRGQIDDLARMPSVLARKLPWLHVDRRRIYAVGSSMGGQETLLLAARHPRLLAGAAALDSDTDLAARYHAFAFLRGGARLQLLAREELGGTPAAVRRAYALRSPIHWAAALARSGVPLHIWWSTRDRIVRDQRDESGRLFRLIRRLNPRAPVTEYVGRWRHSREFHASARLPLALVELGLIRLQESVPEPDRIRRAPGTIARATS